MSAPPSKSSKPSESSTLDGVAVGGGGGEAAVARGGKCSGYGVVAGRGSSVAKREYCTLFSLVFLFLLVAFYFPVFLFLLLVASFPLFPSLILLLLLLERERRMVSLEAVRLKGQESVKSLPEHLQHLTALEELDLEGFCGLESLSKWLGNLYSLQSLFIGCR
ncbi:hypothetical protein RHMOL_Rhmol10G0262300 [Rhododendron molle]|uniref:Uncharacterized protein n=1 Tax=Rhododendron molle TaxID=49168 RepID=A0ACC0M6P8_RHOML|nr:hypothetical protein RHMOL_Rhmol10G0262300 [Rhododendron molle]